MKSIPLTQGLQALVDDSDYERVVQFKWYAARYRDRLVYAQREVKLPDGRRTTLKMHQFIFGEKADHKNGDGLDNRRDNLRAASALQNGSNKRKTRRICTSQFKGVCWAKDRQAWRACIRVNWKLVHIGQFEDEESAARAYDEAAKKYFGEFANLNFRA